MGGHSEECIPSPVQLLELCPSHCGFWLLLLQGRQGNLSSPFASLLYHVLSLGAPPSLCKDTCDFIGPVWIIQNNLHILKSLITSAKSLLHIKQHSQVLGFRMRASLGSIIHFTTVGLMFPFCFYLVCF